MLSRALLFLLLSICFRPSQGQTIPEDELDNMLDTLEQKDKWMGVVAISKKGDLKYQRALGHRVIDEGDTLKASPATRYRIGSVTKMFTATMVGQLVEEGELSYDTPLSKFFPDIPNADSITIDRMLRHRSGLHNFTNDSTFRDYMEKEQSREKMLERIEGMEPDTIPGAKTSYSNTNYVLLGYIIEEITGKSYSGGLQKRILEPLELEQTIFGDGIDPQENEAYSYKKGSKGKWEESTETDPSVPHGAGAITSTAADLTRFAYGLFHGELVDSTTLSEMKETYGGLGRGLFPMPYHGNGGYGHGGRIDNFTAILFHRPEDTLSIALVSNGNEFPNQKILMGILDHIHGRNFELPDFSTVDIPKEELKRYTGTYTSEDIEMDISIMKEDGELKAQGEGQPSFPISPSSKKKFRNDKAGVVLTFDELKEGKYQKLNLEQRGHELSYQREK